MLQSTESQRAGYDFETQQLSINNEQLKCEIKNILPLLIAVKKVFRYKLIKHVVSAYRKLENTHEVIKEALNHWRDTFLIGERAPY